MPFDQAQHDRCLEKHGFTNAAVARCTDEGCTGELRFDGMNIRKTLAFLMCETCGCTSVAPVAEPRPHPAPPAERQRWTCKNGCVALDQPCTCTGPAVGE